MLRLRILFLVALACAAASGLLAPIAVRAQGGPPLITDDPGTPGDGKWEIELAFTVEKTRRKTTYEAPLLDLNYGWGERIQLKYEVPLLVLDEKGEGTKVGAGDSLFGFKYRFLDEEKHGFSMSVYPQVAINSSGRSVDQGLVESGTTVLLPVEVSRTFGKFEVAVEVGYEVVQHDRDEWVYGVAVAYPLTEEVELLAEIHGSADQDFRRNDELLVNVGTRWQFSEHVGLLFSVGRSLYDGDDDPELLLYSGLRFEF